MRKTKRLLFTFVAAFSIMAGSISLTSCQQFEEAINNIIGTDEPVFELVGSNVVNVPLMGVYTEQGVTATYQDKDLSNKVTTTYYLNNKKVNAITTDALQTFTVKYEINTKEIKSTLTRTVNIVEPEVPYVVYKLKGGNEVNVGLGSTYVDKGVVATYNTHDVSDEVVITYYHDGVKADAIQTTEETTYTIKYDLNHLRYHGQLERTVNVVDIEPIDINFLELGNKYTGDCTFIKAGEADILIDAGSRNNSAATIASFVDTYCTDGILEYVIATHAHQDHIAGFVGSTSAEGIFKHYQIDTLIDFSLTNASSSVYNNYISLRNEKIASGDIAHHYTANDYIQGTSGAQRTYDIAAGITMEILDQRFYRETTSDENDYSVCTLFTQGDNHYLFTGDLEKDGEASLVASNNLPEVELFKGGHHGSYTANTDTLLNAIKPKTICICCCAGSDEYTKTPENMFPAQAAVNRMAKHTDKIYVTTLVKDTDPGYQSMNGNINFHSLKGLDYTVTGSNNSTILKETEWFRNNRTWPTS